MIPRCLITLKCRIMLLIHYKQLQIRKWRKKCRAWTDHNIDFPFLRLAELLVFLTLALLGIDKCHTRAKMFSEPRQCLIRQRNLRNQHNRLTALPDHFLDALNIDLCLPTSGYTVQQICMPLSCLYIFRKCIDQRLLLIIQCHKLPVCIRQSCLLHLLRSLSHRLFHWHDCLQRLIHRCPICLPHPCSKLDQLSLDWKSFLRHIDDLFDLIRFVGWSLCDTNHITVPVRISFSKRNRHQTSDLYLLFPCISDPVLKHPVDRTMRNIDYYIRICL